MCPSFPSRHFHPRPVPHHPDPQRQFRPAQEAAGYPKSAPAIDWRESGRLTDSAPNTGYEPNLADFSNYTDLEHNPIDIPDNNPDFRAQMTSPWSPTVQEVCRIPKHWAAAVKPQQARFRFLFGHTGSRENGVGHVSSRSSHRETEAKLDRESVATTLFSSQSRGKREIESWILCMRRDIKITSKRSLHGTLTRPFRERKRLSKICMKLRLRREIGKSEIGIILFRRSIKNLNLSDLD